MQINIQPFEQVPVLDYGFLKVPRCQYCQAFISAKCAISEGIWACYICRKMQKLSKWYMEKPIKYNNFELVCQAEQIHTKRILITIDITSKVLTRMIAPLLQDCLNHYDEVGVIACTPLPTIFKFSPKGNISIETIQVLEPIHTIFYKERQKIKKVVDQLLLLSQHTWIDTGNDNTRSILTQIKNCKIVQFQYLKKGATFRYTDFGQNTLIIDENQTLESEQSLRVFQADQCNECKYLLVNEFYDEAQDLLLERKLGWGGQSRVYSNWQCQDSHITDLPTLDTTTQISYNFSQNDKEDFRCQVEVSSYDRNLKCYHIYNF